MKPRTPPPASILEGAIEANAVRAYLHRNKKGMTHLNKVANRRKMREHRDQPKKKLTGWQAAQAKKRQTTEVTE